MLLLCYFLIHTETYLWEKYGQLHLPIVNDFLLIFAFLHDYHIVGVIAIAASALSIVICLLSGLLIYT